MLSHLVICEKQIVVNDLTAARLLAETYIQADDQSWSSLQAIGLYEPTASAIRRALEVHAIQEIDVWGTDKELWDKNVNHPSDSWRVSNRRTGRKFFLT